MAAPPRCLTGLEPPKGTTPLSEGEIYRLTPGRRRHDRIGDTPSQGGFKVDTLQNITDGQCKYSVLLLSIPRPSPLRTSMEHDEDRLVSVLPIYFSNSLVPNIHIHQFPLLTRPLQAPPSAVLSGKRIRARIKPGVRRLELHIPADTRPEVWNSDRGKELGGAQVEDDREKNQSISQGKLKEGEVPRLGEVRLRSEEIPQKGVHMLGIVRDGLSFALPLIRSLIGIGQGRCTCTQSVKLTNLGPL